MPDLPSVHPAWLPPEALRPLGSRRVLVRGDGLLVETVGNEARRACARYGGSATRVRTLGDGDGDTAAADLILTLGGSGGPGVPGGSDGSCASGTELGDEGFAIGRADGVTTVRAAHPAGLLHGFFHVVRLGEAVFTGDLPVVTHRPAMRRRMADHWDNVHIDPIMGQVERGYAGGSIFWEADFLRSDLSRVGDYARLLACCGINAVSVNNVNVHRIEARLLTERLGDVAKLAEIFRPYGIRVHLSVSFSSPVELGGLSTADPLDPAVRAWWAEVTENVYAAIPDFGGYVVKADSEGQPGPLGYGRTHADGANALAEALAPFGGVVHWRAFVYNHHQDWRDRSTDRARAAYDHFAPLDGEFRDNAILQVKYGPVDFQTREPVSPVLTAMPRTRLAVELQATQEYTGQQKHVCYLAPLWSEVLGFRPWGEAGEDGTGGATIADVARGSRQQGHPDADDGDGGGGGIVVVSNVGDDRFWTGHPLAQANLYSFGRLAWDPQADPAAILDEWIGLTFPAADHARVGGEGGKDGGEDHELEHELLRAALHAMMDDSWLTYEKYTAPLGVGFMVRPGDHYGPDVDGYEYTQWGTYHFADRDGIGVDRTRATGTGYANQYPQPWSDVYESVDQCPDELLLFFHHVPYTHRLHSGKTVIQHIYDTHFEGAQQAHAIRARWQEVSELDIIPVDVRQRMAERLDEQVRCAEEWRDQINTYFLRKSGIPDEYGRTIY